MPVVEAVVDDANDDALARERGRARPEGFGFDLDRADVELAVDRTIHLDLDDVWHTGQRLGRIERDRSRGDPEGRRLVTKDGFDLEARVPQVVGSAGELDEHAHAVGDRARGARRYGAGAHASTVMVTSRQQALQSRIESAHLGLRAIVRDHV